MVLMVWKIPNNSRKIIENTEKFQMWLVSWINGNQISENSEK